MKLPAVLAGVYEEAAFGAMRETSLPLAAFPAACPFTIEEMLAMDRLPG